MQYTTARRIAEKVRAGESWLYTDRTLLEAISELQDSSLYDRGLPGFDADLSALHEELEHRMEGTD